MQDIVVTARLDEQTHRNLRILAEREERSVSWLVRKAVEGYLKGQRVCKEERRQ